ncbi:MAG: galactitol-1-phosphate 5-dehydrogenase [Ktedonobacteraceae bacterium]
MKALVWHGPRNLALEESDEPKPGFDEALIRVAAVGICGSEIEGYLGFNSLRVPPLIMGHEFSGEVAALGPTGGRATLQIGQRVTVNPLISCGTCAFCQAGLFHVCPQRKLIGAHRPGAFANYVVAPLDAIIPVPASLDLKVAALTEPFAVALHGVALARLKAGDAVVVWGAGSIGLLTICAARRAQPGQIIAVDTNPARLESARQMGATTIMDARDDQIISKVRRLLADTARCVAFDAVGRSVTRQASAAVVGPAGCVILLGLHDKETSFDAQNVIRLEMTLQGSYAYTMTDIRQAVDLLTAGQVPAGPWLDIRQLDRGPDAFTELVDRPGEATKIVLVP